MAEKIKGKDLEFWLDGIEIPVISVTPQTNFDTQPSTDSATPATGKDFEAIRAARSFTIEANLYGPDGAEVATGTLTKGQRYRVTGGTITENGNTYEVGRVFESDGTATATATNKVKPLGAKITGKDMAITIASTEFPCTEIGYSEKFDEIDGTDTSTQGDAKETAASRAERDVKVIAILKDTEDDLLTSSPAKQAVEIAMATNVKVVGSGLFNTKNIVANVNDYVKVDYGMKVVGAPAETNFGLVAGVPKAFKIILKRGATSNKEYVGTAVIVSKDIKANISGLATVNYTVNVIGVQTEDVAD